MNRKHWLVLMFHVLAISVSARRHSATKPKGFVTNQPFRLPSPRPAITHVGLGFPDNAGIHVKHYVLDGHPDPINAYSRLPPVPT